jgi:hypothetical protein
MLIVPFQIQHRLKQLLPGLEFCLDMNRKNKITVYILEKKLRDLSAGIQY